MGLDMYLEGVVYLMPECGEERNGKRIKQIVVELGYWRKHPDLHGFIVQNFAGGVDECQKIELSSKDMQKILAANTADEFPHTEGFFFGQSRPEDKEATDEIFRSALNWLEAPDPNGLFTTVVYRASW